MSIEKEDFDLADNYHTLKRISKHGPFTVPEDYFQTSASQIKTLIEFEKLKLKENAFTVSEDFFSEMTSNVQNLIRIESVAGSKDPTFSVPDNYFDSLSHRISEKVKTSNVESERLPVVRKLLTPRIYKYVAAACLLLTFGTAWLLNRPQNINIQQQLTHIADTDLEGYLKLNTDIYDTRILIENVDQTDIFQVKASEFSNDELDEYLTLLN
jgi:hypothetical protein